MHFATGKPFITQNKSQKTYGESRIDLKEVFTKI